EQRPTGYGVPKTMRDAVMRALAKNPEDRPATALEFVGELRAGLLGAGISTTGPTQAMQAAPVAAPSSRGGVDTAVRTGVMPAEHAPLLRSAETPSTEAGLSAVQPNAPGRSSVGILVAAIGAVAALGAGAWFFSQSPGGEAAAPPEAEPSATSTAPEPPQPVVPVVPAPPEPEPSATPTVPEPQPSASTSTPPAPTTSSSTSKSPQPSTTTPKTPAPAPVPCSECMGL